MSHLNYFFTFSDNQEQLAFHLDPDNSDFEPNLVVLSSLVGTLVRTGASGKAEPYLAERYSVSEDRKEWTYTFRKDLVCEDGTPITPSAYASRLTFMLKKYAQSSSPIDFENLRGWQQFLEGKTPSIPGLQVSDSAVTFLFDRAPEALNEFLRMPYFGFWCEGNFDTNGNWKADQKFISSGAFTYVKDPSPNVAQLALREGWFSNSKTSAQTVTFKFINLADFKTWNQENGDQPFFVHSVDGVNWGAIDNALRVQGIPDSLSAVIINPRKASGLADVSLRQALHHIIREEARTAGELKSEFFYATGTSEVRRNSVSPPSDTLFQSRALTLPVRGTHLTERAQMLVGLLNRALPKLGARLEVVYLDPADPATNERMMDPQAFDLRMSAVGIGGHFLNSAVKMIFCTKMGVSFPDPSGRLCELVRQQELSTEVLGDAYIREFNQILEEDASVIPFLHRGSIWFLSNNLTTDTMSPVGEFPNLEDLRIK